jgi:hypothetical protein
MSIGLLFVVTLAVEQTIPEKAGFREGLVAYGAVEAAFVPALVSYSQQESILDLMLASVTRLLLWHSHRHSVNSLSSRILPTIVTCSNCYPRKFGITMINKEKRLFNIDILIRLYTFV